MPSRTTDRSRAPFLALKNVGGCPQSRNAFLPLALAALMAYGPSCPAQQVSPLSLRIPPGMRLPAGDVELEGLVLNVSNRHAETNLLVSVQSIRASGRTMLRSAAPMVKVVQVNDATDEPGDTEDAPVEFQVGDSIVAVGHDEGSRRPMAARAILVEDDGEQDARQGAPREITRNRSEEANPGPTRYAPADSAAAAAGKSSRDAEQCARAVLIAIQQMRRREGIDRDGAGLTWNSTMARVAAARARYTAMLLSQGQPFGMSMHLTPDDPNSAGGLLTRSGYIHSRYMENIDESFGLDPASIFQDWENSPGHAANYRQPDLQDAGIGIAPAPINGQPGYIVVMVAGAQRR